MPDAIGSNFQPMSFDPSESVSEADSPAASPANSPCAPVCPTPKDELVDAAPDLSSALNGDWGSMPASDAPKFSDAEHSQFPTSNGFPIYKQSDTEWRDQQIGTKTHQAGVSDGNSIWAKGCAMTSAAMALSKLTGTTITPAALDAYMKSHGGMNGNSLDWRKIGGIANPPISIDRKALSATEMLNNVRDHKPVVFAINHSGGSSDQHWLLATGIAADGKGITATDPATGKVLTFELNVQGKFECAPYPGGLSDYVMTGSAAVFPKPSQA